MADKPNTTDTQQNYVERLQEDSIAALDARSSNSALNVIESLMNDAREQGRIAEAQLREISANPALIPVPEDEKINPLLVIGQTLRSVGGDSRGLDALVARKSQVANLQRQVEAQNIAIQNRHDQVMRGDLIARLESAHNKYSRLEMERAKIVDQEAATDEERDVAYLETYLGQIESGTMDLDAAMMDDRFAALVSKHDVSQGLLLALNSAGRDAKRMRDAQIERAERPASTTTGKDTSFDDLTRNWDDTKLSDENNLALAAGAYSRQFGIPIENVTYEMVEAGVKDPKGVNPSTAVAVNRQISRDRQAIQEWSSVLTSDLKQYFNKIDEPTRNLILAAIENNTLTREDVELAFEQLSESDINTPRTLRSVRSTERGSLKEALGKLVEYSASIRAMSRDMGGAVDTSLESSARKALGL